MEVEDGLFLPILKPPITRYLAVVLVDFPVSFERCVVLARGQLGPLEQVFARQVRSLGPVLHVVDNLVANIVGDPNAF